MGGTEPAPGTVYLINIPPDDVQALQADVRDYPFAGWRVEPLVAAAALPPDVRSGQAILVLGCGASPVEYGESMLLVRLLASGCPWVAVGLAPDGPTAAECAAAGAAGFVRLPCGPADLRQVLWNDAVPRVGKSAPQAITSDRLLRKLAVLRSDVLLKFTSLAGRVGFLVLSRGHPLNAKVLDGPDGADALQEILTWNKGKVLGQPPPDGVGANLPADSEVWANLLRGDGAADDSAPPPDEAAAVPPGPRLALDAAVCDAVLAELPSAAACAVVDIEDGTVVGRPSGAQLADDEATFLTELLCGAYALADPDESTESAEQVTLLGPDTWYVAARVGTDFGLLIAGNGILQTIMLQSVLAAAAQDLTRGMSPTEAG